jgi:hypothetical protein
VGVYFLGISLGSKNGAFVQFILSLPKSYIQHAFSMAAHKNQDFGFSI